MGDEFVNMAKTMDLVGLGQVGLALAGVTIVAQATIAVTRLAVDAAATVPGAVMSMANHPKPVAGNNTVEVN